MSDRQAGQSIPVRFSAPAPAAGGAALRCHIRMRAAQPVPLLGVPDGSAGFRLEEPGPMPMASLSSPSGPLARFSQGLAEAINHAFGIPREQGAHLPPLVAVQPYRDRPRRCSR
jgi:hypothetical protein